MKNMTDKYYSDNDFVTISINFCFTSLHFWS